VNSKRTVQEITLHRADCLVRNWIEAPSQKTSDDVLSVYSLAFNVPVELAGTIDFLEDHIRVPLKVGGMYHERIIPSYGVTPNGV
jgi:hypothetical protein